MAVFYAVEFPLEDARGPYIVPESRVKVENGSIRVLWSVVDELNGDLKEVYFEATSLREGTKKECADFVDHLKKSREEAKISNKGGVRSRKKPSKFDDYDSQDTDCLAVASGKPPAKKARKTLELSFSNPDPEELQLLEESEPFDPETEGTAILNKWKKRALSASEKKANGSSRQNSKTNKHQPQNSVDSVKKPQKPRVKKTEPKAEEDKIKSAQKKARSETAESQSINIGKAMYLEMKLLLHGDNNDTPAELTISVAPETTFEGLKNKIAQTTRISANNQLLVVKGKEWEMEKQERICDIWSTDDLVAIFEKDKPSSEFSSERTTRSISTLADSDDDEVDVEDGDNDLLPSDGTQKEMQATTTGDLQSKVDKLIQQVSLMTHQMEQLRAAVKTFAKCKVCIKKHYKSVPVDDGNCIPEERQSTVAKISPAPALVPARAPAPVVPFVNSVSPNQENKAKRPIQKQSGESAEDTCTMLIGAPSRGVYVSKKKVELLPKSSTPKLFALKLFELVFNREEAKRGSVEGKGEKLSQLDPNRIAALREQTERRFPGDNNLKWVEIKKGIDEKCRMVRNNRCFVWGGVNVNIQKD